MAQSVLSQFLQSFPNNSVTIERFSETLNDIWEKEKSWEEVFTDIKCLFLLRSQNWDNNEMAQKDKIKAQYECRIELEDIDQQLWDTAITKVNEKDRAIVWWKIYQVQFVIWELWDTSLIDHCNLILELVE